jgi:hypothetical protein
MYPTQTQLFMLPAWIVVAPAVFGLLVSGTVVTGALPIQ